jgi:hypothetical protein
MKLGLRTGKLERMPTVIESPIGRREVTVAARLAGALLVPSQSSSAGGPRPPALAQLRRLVASPFPEADLGGLSWAIHASASRSLIPIALRISRRGLRKLSRKLESRLRGLQVAIRKVRPLTTPMMPVELERREKRVAGR